jgi:hypothetical protein
MGMDPITGGMLIMSVLSMAVQAAGQVQQGRAIKRQEQFNAAVSRNNQIIAQRKADDARSRGEVEAQRRQRITGLQRGQATAEAAARGVEVGSGSALDIQADISGIGAEEEAIIRNNAEREALGFEGDAMNFGAQAQLSGLKASDASRAGFMEAGRTILSGASSVAGRWYTLRGGGDAGSNASAFV